MTLERLAAKLFGVEGGTLVLLSGGIDSSATLALCRRRSDRVSALFVDYGQRASDPELLAARGIADHFNVHLHVVGCTGLGDFGAGYVRGRNALLLQIALANAPFTTGTVAIGVHAGTNYVDCSPTFVSEIQRTFDLYCDGTIRIVAPFLEHTKQAVIAFAREHGLPFDVMYSCERGFVPPCGECLSCRDRKTLDV